MGGWGASKRTGVFGAFRARLAAPHPGPPFALRSGAAAQGWWGRASLRRPFLVWSLTLTRSRNGEMGPSLVPLARANCLALVQTQTVLGASHGSREGHRLQSRQPPDPCSRIGPVGSGSISVPSKLRSRYLSPPGGRSNGECVSPGSEIRLPALHERSSTDLPLRVPGPPPQPHDKTLLAWFSTVFPAPSVTQRGLASEWPKHTPNMKTTLDGGSHGSCVDEECS
ncbi:hypothetical protein EOD39_21926 [Acipenser ruthenus]|uniref:Uncharacterized protein n=1 Tax=Acipenser ruthenus TaxID=7906 RepID=A0A444URC3_ACIRT|nr:hypothetical protein EOD39_21926 [Acipenser ruthenus]